MLVIDASIVVSSYFKTEKFHRRTKKFLHKFIEREETILLPEIAFPEIASAIARGTRNPQYALDFCGELRKLPNFVFIPVVREIEKTAFPAANPPALPPVIKSSAFPSALVSGRLIFLNTAQEPHALKEWKNEQPVKLMEFERPLKNPVLFGAETAQRLLIQEENGFYLIDLEKRSRKKLDTLNLALAARWVGDMLIFEEAEGSIRKILWLHDDLQTREELPAETLENIAALSPGILVFLASKKLGADAPKIGPSIEEALEEGRKEFEENPNQTLYLTQFDIQKKLYRTLASIEINGKETVSRLTVVPTEKKFYFMKGEKAFEVILEK